jgi:hypothetical protein
MSVSHFVLSAVCIGFANTCIEWFIIGFLFHKFQATTPQTWRPESNRSYMYSTLLSFLFGALFTFFYWKIGRQYVLRSNILWSDIKLGIICFACFNFILEVGNAIYINYANKFVAGKLIASCLSYIAAAIIAGLIYWR